MTPPDVSVTVPLMLPTPCAAAVEANPSMMRNTATCIFPTGMKRIVFSPGPWRDFARARN